MNPALQGQLKLIFIGSEGLLKGLIVYVIFYSSRKNNFTIGPLLSNAQGEIILCENVVRKVISNSKNDFPMDYDGGIEDCYKVEVIVESMEELKSRFDRLNEFYSDSAASLHRIMARCSNGSSSFKGEITQKVGGEAINIAVL